MSYGLEAIIDKCVHRNPEGRYQSVLEIKNDLENSSSTAAYTAFRSAMSAFMGWNKAAGFTIENNFWNGDCGRKIINAVQALPYNWRFVPSDCNDVPAFVPKEFVIDEEAEEDESWEFDEHGINCCSICLPVKGEMHSDHGVLAREISFYNFTEALARILANC